MATNSILCSHLQISHRNNDGVIDFEEFQTLNKRYPMILFPCFRLQDRMQKSTLGESHWLALHTRYYQFLKTEAYMVCLFDVGKIKVPLTLIIVIQRKHNGAMPPISAITKVKHMFGIGTFEVYQPQ